jgi:hypothetical protein
MNNRIIERLQLYSLSNYRCTRYDYLKYLYEYSIYPFKHINTTYCDCIECNNCNDINSNDINSNDINSNKCIDKYHVFISQSNYGKCDMSIYCKKCNQYKKPEFEPDRFQIKQNRILHKDYRYPNNRMSYSEIERKNKFLLFIPFILSILLFPFTLLMMIFMIVSDWMRSIIEFIIYHNDNDLFYFINIERLLQANIFAKIKYLIEYTIHIMYRPILNKIKSEFIKINYIVYQLIGFIFILEYGNLYSIILFLFMSLIFYPKYLFFSSILIASTIANIPFVLLNYIYIFATYMFYIIRVKIIDFCINKSAYPILLCDETYHNFENINDCDTYIYVNELVDKQINKSANIAKLSYSVILYQILLIIPKTLLFIFISLIRFVFIFFFGTKNL